LIFKTEQLFLQSEDSLLGVLFAYQEIFWTKNDEIQQKVAVLTFFVVVKACSMVYTETVYAKIYP